MAFLVVNPAPIKTISLLLLTFLIWHGGSGVSAVPEVTQLKATDVTSTSVLLTWTVPTDTNAPNYTYVIKVSTNTIFVENITTGANANNTSVISLKAGVIYDFNVYTNYSNTLSTAVSISATTIPSLVTNLNSGSITNTSVTLSWITPSDQNNATYKYVITISNHSPPNVTTGAGVNNYTITSLKPGVNYTFAVITETINSVLSDTPVLVVTATTLPSQISNLKTGTITTTNVTLSWDTPNDQNNATYTYEITVSNPSPGTYTTAPGAKSYTITGLKPGVIYTFTVRTKTSNSVLSAASATVTDTTLPSPVTNLKTETITTTNVTLSWDTPNDQNNATYTYEITVSNPSPGTYTTAPGAKSYTITGLKPGVIYTFIVRTKTSNSVLSAASATVTDTTLPSPVTNLKTGTITTTNVTLSWDTPNDQNNATYTYEITVSNPSPGTYTTAPGAKSYPITGLKPGVDYTFIVRTKTSNSVLSAASATVTDTTLPSPVTNLKTGTITTTNVTLSWDTPNDQNNATYTYEITVSNPSPATYTTAPGAKSYTITGLKPGVDYTFIVRTKTSNSVLSAASATVTETTLPSPVTNLKTGTITTTNVTLSWDTPNDQNNATYIYEITVSNPSPATYTTAPGAKSYTITGLKPGVIYTFTVRTKTSNSVLSAASATVTDTTLPSPVTNLKTGTITTTEVTLSWDTPNDQNNATYTYEITVSNPSPGTHTTAPGAKSYTVTGLKPGVIYTFIVRTKTSNSVLSAASATVTETTLPSRVTGLTIGTITTTNVTLSWNLPDDQNNATYRYVIIISNHSPENVTSGAGANSYTFTDLKPGENYTFAVQTQTINSVLSAASEPATATTKPSPVSGLAIASRTTNTVTLTWNTPTNDSNKATYTYVIIVLIHNPGTFTTAENANSYTIPGLNPGVNYSFTVYTQTINLVQSIANAFINGTTIPSRVPSIELVNRSNSSITFMWTTPSDVRVKEYKYNVFYTGIEILTINNNFSASDLQPGSQYTFNVTSEIDSLKSAISTFTVYTIPNQPGNLGGGSVSTSSINVSWQAPNDPNANSYEYNVTWIEGVSQNTTGNDNTYNTSMVIQGLQAGYQYGVIIHSMIGDVSSEPSTIYLLTDPNIIKSPEIGNITNSSVIFRWTWPESGVTGMEIKSTTANAATIEIITDRSITEYEMTNLTPGNFYEFTLRSYKNSDTDVLSSGRIHRREAAPTGRTTYSEPVTRTIQILPAHVTNIKCSKVGGGYAIIVHFDCPKGNFTELNVLVNGGTSDALTNCSDSGDVTVRSLQPANGYDVQVQTVAYPLKVLTIIHRCSTDNVGVIVGAIFGVLLFLLLVGLIAFFILRKRRSKKTEMEIPDVKKQRRFRTLSKEQFADYFQQQHANSDFGFAEEYQELGSVGTKQLKREAELPDNRSKNRFTNVLPYDHSRVKLDSTGGNEISDYINANYMPVSKNMVETPSFLPNTHLTTHDTYMKCTFHFFS
uniref:Fibronectin type-III domain-containing protein n=1 Tax=Leptobrachium leishanense TaxID=445787 RepID=A0A8C5MLG6_9ANUR